MNYSLFEEDELLALSRFDMKNHRYDSALEKLKVLLERERVLIDAFALAGKLYASLGLYERAKHAFTVYTENVSDAYLELFQLGMVEKDMGNLDGAKEIWSKVLELSPNHAEALYFLGEACFQQNDIESARDWLFRLLETAPDESEYIALADQLLNRIRAH